MSDDNKKTTIDDNFIKLFDLKTPEKILENTFNDKTSKKFHENILLTRNNFRTINELKSQLPSGYYVLENKDTCSVFQKFSDAQKDNNTMYFDKSFRNSTYIDMFFNAIPTSVLAQLLPYLKISFLIPEENRNKIKTDITSMPALQNYVSDDKKYLEKFNELFIIDFKDQNSVNSSGILNGSENDFYFNQALPRDGKYFLTDESIYTSSPNISNNFRPLLSISKLSIKAVPTKDFNISFDEYNLSLVIHDKTKLHKFKYLIGVEYRDMISAVIEYGWSYPDYTDNGVENVYSYFFNKVLRKKVYCKLVNASYNFDEVGQVKLEMKLMTKGAEHLIVLNALTNAGEYSDAIVELQRLKNELNIWLNEYKIPTSVKDGILLSRLSDESADVITGEQSKKLDELIKTLSLSTDQNTKTDFLDDAGKKRITENIDQLKKYLLEDKSKTNRLKQSYNLFVDNTINNFKSWVSTFRKSKAAADTGYYTQNKISGDEFYLHEIIQYFIGETVVKKDRGNGIIEFQAVYYNFNKSLPETMAGRSIAEFKINKNEFTRLLKEENHKKLTLEQFIGFLLNNFLNKLESSGYNFVQGLENIYKTDGTIDSEKQKINKQKLEKAMKNSEESGVTIVEPRISFRVENVNKIMRIHIYDIANRIIFKANIQQVGQLDHIKKLFEEWKDEESLKQKQQKQFEIQTKTDQILSDTNRKNFSYIKQIFSGHYPIINFDGIGSSVIKSFNISNSMDPATTTHLINKLYDNIKKDNVQEENFYTRVVPGKITLETLGFPLAEIHQIFFVDANTGTDIDNLYNVTSVVHNIEPGSFKTSYELGNADSYGAHENIYREINRIKNIVNGNVKEVSKQQKPNKGKSGVGTQKSKENSASALLRDEKIREISTISSLGSSSNAFAKSLSELEKWEKYWTFDKEKIAAGETPGKGMNAEDVAKVNKAIKDKKTELENLRNGLQRDEIRSRELQARRESEVREEALRRRNS